MRLATGFLQFVALRSIPSQPARGVPDGCLQSTHRTTHRPRNEEMNAPEMLSGTTRFATAAVVAVIVAVTWVCAAQASHTAVQNAEAAMALNVTRVELPSVRVLASASTSAAQH
jgi:hypothetical protein